MTAIRVVPKKFRFCLLKIRDRSFFLPRKCCQADRQTACLHAELSVHPVSYTHLIRDDGISYIPEDRIKTGAAGNISLWGNMIADIIDSPLLKKHGLLNCKNIHERADKLISDFGVLCQNDDQPIGMLSGGNMQKVVVAREFSSRCV